MLKFTPMDRTKEKAQWLWENIRRLGQFTLDDDHQEYAELDLHLADPQNLYFEAQEEGKPIGYVSVVPVTAWAALVHATFFDLRTRGREDRLNALARWVMGHSAYTMLRAATPATHRSSVALLRRMGWSEDGRVRAAMRRNGKFIDVVLFSVTREESANGRHFRRRIKEAEGQGQDHASSRDTGDTNAVAEIPDCTHVSGGWDASDFWQFPLDGSARVSGIRPHALRADDIRVAEQHGGGTGQQGGVEPDIPGLARWARWGDIEI